MCGEKHFNETFGLAKIKARLYSGMDMDKDKGESQIFSLHNHRKDQPPVGGAADSKGLCYHLYDALHALWKYLPLDLTTVLPLLDNLPVTISNPPFPLHTTSVSSSTDDVCS